MRKALVLLSAAIGMTILLLIAAYSMVHQERRAFEQKIAIGLSKDEVLARVGPPEQVIESGGNLHTWGNAREHRVAHETWVYFVIPKSQHRFVLTFEQDRVAAIEYNVN